MVFHVLHLLSFVQKDLSRYTLKPNPAILHFHDLKNTYRAPSADFHIVCKNQDRRELLWG